MCVLQTGIARLPPGIAIRSFAGGTPNTKAAVLGYAWQGVGNKVHGPVATCKSRQSISRMRMCMQMDDSSESEEPAPRAGIAWHDMAWHGWV
jgi:hypothetical protein